jgi:CDP-6-deoxy-D-xylo-4-hexulose-3-dehydrase
LPKLDGFIAKRKENFARLTAGLAPCAEQLRLPRATPGSDPAWFGFPLAVEERAGFSRTEIITHLEARGIGTRLLFGGNLLKQPAYAGTPRRLPGPLAHTDWVMKRVFWIGLWPGLTAEMLDYMIETLTGFCRR